MPVPGNVFRATVEFKNRLTDQLADPTTVTFIVRTPAGVETSYVYGVAPEVIKSAIGRYYMDVQKDESRHWDIRAKGTGGGPKIPGNLFVAPGGCGHWSCYFGRPTI